MLYTWCILIQDEYIRFLLWKCLISRKPTKTSLVVKSYTWIYATFRFSHACIVYQLKLAKHAFFLYFCTFLFYLFKKKKKRIKIQKPLINAPLIYNKKKQKKTKRQRFLVCAFFFLRWRILTGKRNNVNNNDFWKPGTSLLRPGCCSAFWVSRHVLNIFTHIDSMLNILFNTNSGLHKLRWRKCTKCITGRKSS